jgi:1-acyl-sn-glycerol-3-phosphate acyltransferase
MPLPDLPPEPVRPLSLLRRVLALLLTAALSLAMLLLNLLQVASILVRPLSKRHFRAINRWVAKSFWGLCVAAARRLYGVRVRLCGDPLPAAENAIVILNHQGMADIPVLLDLAAGTERLGDLKWFAKDVIKWAPGVGWGLLFIDCIFLKRNWAADQDSIEATFHRLLADQVPCWIVSFVEGTRIRPAKHAASRRYAEEHRLPPLEHLLLPRTKGFTATVTGMRDHVQAIYDCTVGYVEGVPTLWQWIQGRMPVVNCHLRRIEIAELPHDRTALSAWLVERWQIKDRRLAHYYQTGSFPISDAF